MKRLRCDCGRALGYEPRHAGKKVRCPGCQKVLTVPTDEEDVPTVESAEEDIPEVEAADEPRRARSASARPKPARDEAPRRDEPDDEEAEDEGPARKKRRRKVERTPTGGMYAFGAVLANQVGVWVIVILGGAGIGLLVYGFREGKVSTGATDAPRAVTAQQLIDEGGGGNPHVLVSDLEPGNDFAYEVKVTQAEKNSGNTQGKPWVKVYVPIYPKRPGPQAGPPTGPVRLMLLSKTARNTGDLTAVFNGQPIQGLIINAISKLDDETKNLLRGSAGGGDLDRVLILEQGRKPSSRGFAVAMISVGAVMAVTSALLGVIALVYRPRGW